MAPTSRSRIAEHAIGNRKGTAELGEVGLPRFAGLGTQAQRAGLAQGRGQIDAVDRAVEEFEPALAVERADQLTLAAPGGGHIEIEGGGAAQAVEVGKG